jgi:acetyltransferase-like isoleucine patch superfamily enzyme
MRALLQKLERILVRALPKRHQGAGWISLRADVRGPANRIRVDAGAFVQERASLVCKGEGTRIEIGSGSFVDPYAELNTTGGSITIGKDSCIHSFCVLYGAGGLTIGDHVRIATHALIIGGNHGFDVPDAPIHEQEGTKKGIRIGDDVWIGAGAIILDGVTIGAHAVIGAGSVVTRDIPADAVAMGVPAKVARMRGETKKPRT